MANKLCTGGKFGSRSGMFGLLLVKFKWLWVKYGLLLSLLDIVWGKFGSLRGCVKLSLV